MTMLALPAILQQLATPAITTVVSDTFTRANSTTTLGSAETGQAWTAQAGTWGIASNQAYCSTGPGQETVVVESGVSDCTVSVTLPVSGDSGLCFRSTNASNYWVWANNSGALYKKVAGAFTQVGSSVGAGANGDIIEAVLSGSSIIIKRNGTQVLSVTDSFNATATKHGLRSNGSSGHRFDNFTVTVD